ncbi:class I SAM-dependent methyltransferase [Methanospirillum sp.]
MIVGKKNQITREIWLEETLKSLSPGTRILDAGAGELRYKKFCSHLNYVSQDFAQYDGMGDYKGLQTKTWDQTKLDIISDITAIPEPNNSFDAIMCIEVFEHLPEPIKAIEEFSRLLKNEGHLIITAPFCSLTHFAPYHFYSGFNRYFYENHLTNNGFHIEELVENGNYFEYLAQEIRRIPSVTEKYSRKKFFPIHYIAQQWLLWILGKYSLSDTGSDELLCFGYHVHAIKKKL